APTPAKPPAAAKPPPAAPAAAASAAATTDVLGTVLAIQGEELVVDLGAGSGATDGASVEIWRPIKLKHPVTGKAIDDRFQIGSLELLQVRASMSLAKASAQLTRAAQVGDVVILHRAVVRPSLPPPPGEPPSQENPAVSELKPGATPADVEAATISAMFES